MKMNTNFCQILKYADDTIILGLMNNDDESEYRSAIDYVSEWCTSNYLELNVSKTKEMIFDFRKSKYCEKDPVIIHGCPVSITDQYKYLGVTVQSNLKWDIHVKNQIVKANKRMYQVYLLHNIHVDATLICLYFNSVVMSVISYAVTCWFRGSCSYLKKDLNRFVRRLYKLTPVELHNLIVPLNTIFENKCRSLVEKIMSDDSHPLFQYLNFFNHHNKKLRMMYCRTNRFKNSFIPSAISVFNDKS